MILPCLIYKTINKFTEYIKKKAAKLEQPKRPQLIDSFLNNTPNTKSQRITA